MTSTGAPGPSPPGDSGADSSSAARRVRLHGWRHPAILAVAAATVAAGFAQFGATSSLGDVARTFGQSGEGTSLVARVGLSGTTLGVGLAIVRLASLASLPLAALADRHGRRRMLLGCVSGGLAVTALAALSPGYWWFVALFAIGRPLLSATSAIAVVVAAEETETRDRAKAIALMTAGYGIGAGLTALARGVAGDLGFRGLFALALVPLAAMPLLARRLEEPDRYQRLRVAADPEPPAARTAVLGRVRADLRPRLWLLAVLAFSIAFVTGPMNTFLFVYAENALGMSRSTTAAMVVLGAGPIGLVGLLIGRWAAGSPPPAPRPRSRWPGCSPTAVRGPRWSPATCWPSWAPRPTRRRSAPSAPSCSRPACGPPWPAGWWPPGCSGRWPAWSRSACSPTPWPASPPPPS